MLYDPENVPKDNCPILFYFRDELAAEEFVTTKAAIASYTPCKNITIFIDKILFQRDILRSQKCTGTSQVGEKSVVYGAPSLASTLPVQFSPDEANPGSTAMVSSNLLSLCDKFHHPTSPITPCPTTTTRTYIPALITQHPSKLHQAICTFGLPLTPLNFLSKLFTPQIC